MSVEEVSKVDMDVNLIKDLIGKIVPKFSQIESVYLFGSVARGEADIKSDVDLFFLIRGESDKLYVKLSQNKHYKELEDYASEKVEGGLNSLICNEKELIEDFDTLTDKILFEGIKLHGKDLTSISEKIERNESKNSSRLLDLVRSL